MKNLVLLSTLFASLFFIVNCSPNKSTSNNNATANINGVCPAGYWYQNGQCYNGSNTVGAGINLTAGFYADSKNQYGSSMTIVDVNLMKQVFKQGMGVCDLASHTYGAANCDAYIQGTTYLVLQLPPDTTVASSSALSIYAYPAQNPYFNYQASFGSWWQVAAGFFGIYIPDTNYYSGAYRNPLQVQMTSSPANNSTGFMSSGYGDMWTGYNSTLITVEVASGNSNSPAFNYTLKVGGQTAATGRMVRCQNPNCN